MRAEEMDFDGKIKWLNMGNGSLYVEKKYIEDFRFDRFVSGFIKFIRSEDELLETFDMLFKNRESFIRELSSLRMDVVKRILEYIKEVEDKESLKVQ